MENKQLKVAIIDLNNNVPNLGLRSIEKMVRNYTFENFTNFSFEYQVFDLRHKGEIPDTNFDIYLSSGGPGSPFEGEGTLWEKQYFDLVAKLWEHNKTASNKKYFLFICHSFQLMCRYFDLGKVTKRHSMSFGITQVHKTNAGENEPCFSSLANPFYVADFRDYQVLQPNEKQLEKLGAAVLCLEKIRPHIDKERAIMAIRVSDEFLGTQFHPEAHSKGMKMHFLTAEKKALVIEHHGEKKYNEMLEHLEDPDKVSLTNQVIIPNFLNTAVRNLLEFKMDLV